MKPKTSYCHTNPTAPPQVRAAELQVPTPTQCAGLSRLLLCLPKCSWTSPIPPPSPAASPGLNVGSVYYSREAISKGVEILVKIKVKNVNRSQAHSPSASKASCFCRHRPPASLRQVSVGSGEKQGPCPVDRGRSRAPECGRSLGDAQLSRGLQTPAGLL